LGKVQAWLLPRGCPVWFFAFTFGLSGLGFGGGSFKRPRLVLGFCAWRVCGVAIRFAWLGGGFLSGVVGLSVLVF